MAAKLARKAKAIETAEPAQAQVWRAEPAPSRGGSLDPLILALTRAVDRQAPAQPSGQRDTRPD